MREETGKAVVKRVDAGESCAEAFQVGYELKHVCLGLHN